jgi:hypothetical protein
MTAKASAGEHEMHIVYTDPHRLHAADQVHVGGYPFDTKEVPARQGVYETGRRGAGLGLPTLVVQEGGYLLERLGEGAAAFLQAFAA